jgi:hypothetical protein
MNKSQDYEMQFTDIHGKTIILKNPIIISWNIEFYPDRYANIKSTEFIIQMTGISGKITLEETKQIEEKQSFLPLEEI